MQSSFGDALAATLVEEGGYSNNPKDPGGSTYRGVTQATYDNYRKGQKLPTQDVRNISDQELTGLYTTMYWLPAGCDSLPPGVDMEHFDMAVNSGPKEAIETLQRACIALGSKIANDGVFGSATLAAVNGLNKLSLINEYATQRVATYRRFGDYPSFGAEWTDRTTRIRSKAINYYTSVVVSGRDVVKPPSQPVPVTASPRVQQSGLIAVLCEIWQRWFGGDGPGGDAIRPS